MRYRIGQSEGLTVRTSQSHSAASGWQPFAICYPGLGEGSLIHAGKYVSMIWRGERVGGGTGGTEGGGGGAVC